MRGLDKSAIERTVKKKTVIFDRFAPTYALADGVAALGLVGNEQGNFHGSETLCAKRISNCDYSGNLLRIGLGAQPLVTAAGNTLTKIRPKSITGIIHARFGQDNGGAEYFLISFEDGYLYVYDESIMGLVQGPMIGKGAQAASLRSAKGEEKYLIVGELGSCFFCADGSFSTTALVNPTRAFCVCKSRLFLAQKGGRLLYSDPMTPWRFDESIDDGGYIELPIAYGDPIALVAEREYVYVFFKRAVMRLQVKGGARDFRLEEIHYSGKPILEGSVCASGDGVIFLVHSELWIVRGLKTERFCEGLVLGLYPYEDKCSSVVCEGKYFLRFSYGLGKTQSVAVDLDGKSWYSCYDLLGLTADANSALFVRQETLYQLGIQGLPNGESAAFESVNVDFGIRGKKTLRRLSFSGVGSFSLRLHCDGRFVTYVVPFINGTASLELDMRGESFAFSFVISPASALRSVSADIVA